jgi:hypothetical protein
MYMLFNIYLTHIRVTCHIFCTLTRSQINLYYHFFIFLIAFLHKSQSDGKMHREKKDCFIEKTISKQTFLLFQMHYKTIKNNMDLDNI